MKKYILVSYDGILIDPSCDYPKSFEMTFRQIDSSFDQHIDWTRVLSESRSSTEKNLVQKLYNKLKPLNTGIDDFASIFFETRASWFEDKESAGFLKSDMIYPDALEFLFRMHLQSDVEIFLVSFDSKIVANKRIPLSLRRFFASKQSHDLSGIFGDEGFSKEILIQKFLERLDAQDGKIVYNSTGNVFFVCNYLEDLKITLQKGLKAIFLPTRNKQEFDEVVFKPEYRSIVQKSLNRVKTTRKLDSEEVFDFIFN